MPRLLRNDTAIQELIQDECSYKHSKLKSYRFRHFRRFRHSAVYTIPVLEVPQSTASNRYLLVLQDYFTKWVEVFPMPDQTVKRITNILISLCARMGLPRIIHSDQGQNFKSAILHQTLQAFGVNKSHTSGYHPQGDRMVEHLKG